MVHISVPGVFTDANGEDYALDFDIPTARFDGGWRAEVRIPLSSLPYAAGQQQPWNLMVMRNLTRDTRYKMFSGPLPRTSNCLLCYAEPITGLRELPTGLNWTATPQIVMRKGREDVAGQPRRDFSSRDLSLDVKIRADSASVTDATINPDFSQIELDAPQLSGNTRFGLFVPEKRPFFLEGSDMLQTPFRAINTRTISDPGWGARWDRGQDRRRGRPAPVHRTSLATERHLPCRSARHHPHDPAKGAHQTQPGAIRDPGGGNKQQRHQFVRLRPHGRPGDCCVSRTHPVRWRYARRHAEAPPERTVRQTLVANLSNIKGSIMKTEYDFLHASTTPNRPVKRKTRITIYLDDEVIEEFRSLSERSGKGYQTLINAALRTRLAAAHAEPAGAE
ncbi:MAG TPA: BrnA antitoxin family protein [Telluria sp.]|nr:BrnA antitoxin family protein [Telluria sp.]